MNNTFNEGDRVYKTGGDYRFNGIVVAAFAKRSGCERFVVENHDGLLHIFSAKQLALVTQSIVQYELFK